LGLYKKSKASTALLDNVFVPNDLLGQVFVLTSDGWLITSIDAVNWPKDEMVVYYNGKNYPIDKIIKDDLSKIVFLKINIQNLPVIKMADLQKATNGQQIFIYNSYFDRISIGSISDKSFKSLVNKYDLVLSSQALDKYILLNDDFSAEVAGSPVFNLSGEIIGLLDGNYNNSSKVIPINYISPIINQVLKGEVTQRPYLGVYYLDLSTVWGLGEEDRQKAENGALIWSNKNGIAIAADSPLTGKLVKGDIITSIENQILDENNDLADLLLSYKSGQEIRLKYLHEGKENEINITLK
jgi:serine protease Do